MTEAPLWTCSFSDGPRAKLADLTVGSPFVLKCSGDLPVEWSEGPLRLVFPAEDQAYTLALLKTVKLEPTTAEFEVTGYKPGNHKPDYVRVLQGERGFEFSRPQWEIKSVLKQDQQPQPFGPFGPYTVPLPMWVWLALLLAAAALALLIWRGVRRSSQRRALREELKRHGTTLTPLNQFYRDSRALKRRLDKASADSDARAALEDLDRDFRLYVLRRFSIPALEWSEAAILGDVRRRHRRVFQRAADPLRKTLRELRRLKGRDLVPVRDVEQLHRMSLEAVDRLDQAAEEAKR